MPSTRRDTADSFSGGQQTSTIQQHRALCNIAPGIHWSNSLLPLTLQLQHVVFPSHIKKASKLLQCTQLSWHRMHCTDATSMSNITTVCGCRTAAPVIAQRYRKWRVRRYAVNAPSRDQTNLLGSHVLSQYVMPIHQGGQMLVLIGSTHTRRCGPSGCTHSVQRQLPSLCRGSHAWWQAHRKIRAGVSDTATTRGLPPATIDSCLACCAHWSTMTTRCACSQHACSQNCDPDVMCAVHGVTWDGCTLNQLKNTAPQVQHGSRAGLKISPVDSGRCGGCVMACSQAHEQHQLRMAYAQLPRRQYQQHAGRTPAGNQRVQVINGVQEGVLLRPLPSIQPFLGCSANT
jgi:hypothetical protein